MCKFQGRVIFFKRDIQPWSIFIFFQKTCIAQVSLLCSIVDIMRTWKSETEQSGAYNCQRSSCAMASLVTGPTMSSDVMASSRASISIVVGGGVTLGLWFDWCIGWSTRL